MKIQIEGGGKRVVIPIPTAMIFSWATVDLGLKLAKKYAGNSRIFHISGHGPDIQLQDIPPEAVHAICDEIRRIKKKHGAWLLVDVQTGNNDKIRITL